ncbi:Methyltransferase type 11 [uncultured Alphaproteobacteria bacterium]|uniref:Methyltransferase type 11 n=1 Tax=uncultured Alphaproteobacteria bacterium TaxID=91750 RepID=A0A212JF58_9PROT|nr:Methyltransferase type 11 [uncultured Alphaproteobacteria bacterium]
MRIARGLSEDGVVVGNVFDKYGSRNPVVRALLGGFSRTLNELVAEAAPATLHEIGCGEGYWTARWYRQGIAARGSDFSEKVVGIARANAAEGGVPPDIFTVRSIYDLKGEDGADLLVCCEVLEHLERPEDALRVLREVAKGWVILSVPREPLWRIMNMARGKYLGDLGNTPGHVQHWSHRGFMEMVSRHLQIVSVRLPIPWTMLLCRVPG